MNKQHLDLHQAYKVATVEHLRSHLQSAGWGPSTDDELAAMRDAACAYDGAGCDMSTGGLTDDEIFLANILGQ